MLATTQSEGEPRSTGACEQVVTICVCVPQGQPVHQPLPAHQRTTSSRRGESAGQMVGGMVRGGGGLGGLGGLVGLGGLPSLGGLVGLVVLVGLGAWAARRPPGVSEQVATICVCNQCTGISALALPWSVSQAVTCIEAPPLW